MHATEAPMHNVVHSSASSHKPHARTHGQNPCRFIKHAFRGSGDVTPAIRMCVGVYGGRGIETLSWIFRGKRFSDFSLFLLAP